ncbi:MAG: hypothetical protein ACK4PN_12720 [Allorhizobium sp.]
MIRDEKFYAVGNSEFEQLNYRLMLRGTTTLYPMARRDPIITPIVTSFSISVGFSSGVAAVLGAVVTAVATTAISIGLNMLLAPKPPKPEDGKAPMTQAIPPRFWVVGRRRIAGALMLWEAKGRALCSVQALAGHRIKGGNRYYLHDDQVTLDVDGYVHGPAGGALQR